MPTLQCFVIDEDADDCFGPRCCIVREPDERVGHICLAPFAHPRGQRLRSKILSACTKDRGELGARIDRDAPIDPDHAVLRTKTKIPASMLTLILVQIT